MQTAVKAMCATNKNTSSIYTKASVDEMLLYRGRLKSTKQSAEIILKIRGEAEGYDATIIGWAV